MTNQQEVNDSRRQRSHLPLPGDIEPMSVTALLTQTTHAACDRQSALRTGVVAAGRKR